MAAASTNLHTRSFEEQRSSGHLPHLPLPPMSGSHTGLLLQRGVHLNDMLDLLGLWGGVHPLEGVSLRDLSTKSSFPCF